MDKSKTDVSELMQYAGSVAEMSLIIYRALVNSGADKEEAIVLTSICLDSILYGSPEE